MTTAPKRLTLPKCGTCDLAVPIDNTKDEMWCHGAPPSAFPKLVVEMVEGQPVQRQTISSAYPPVRRDMVGCAKHPQVRRKL
jgi:hypothetical protein